MCASARLAVAVLPILFAVPVFAWHSSVQPPSPDLPAVEIDVGYPGGYINASGAPIELRARAGARPFDGYVGFHLRVGNIRTSEEPLLARAQIPSRGHWTMQATVRRWYGHTVLLARGHVIVIEWRDARGRIIATASAGALPTQLEKRPLRILRDGESDPGGPWVRGRAAVAVPASSLPARADWYSGFDSIIIVPIDVWFTLPGAVRTAIFHSGSSVRMFGVPAAVPRMSRVDEAMIPVTFESGAGSVRLPRVSGGEVVLTPVRWRARSHTRFAGDEICPPLVIGRAGVYAVNERLIREPVPVNTASLILAGPAAWSPAKAEWSPRALRRLAGDATPVIAVVAATLLCVALWAGVRRNRFGWTAAVALAAVVAHPLYREVIRQPSGQRTKESLVQMGDGVSRHHWDDVTWGVSPLRLPPRADRATIAHAVFHYQNIFRDGVCILNRDGSITGWFERDWASLFQESGRVDFGKTVSIRFTEWTETRLSFHYDLPRPADRVLVRWSRDGRQHTAMTTLRGTRGAVTVRDGIGEADWRLDLVGSEYQLRLPRRRNLDGVTMIFFSSDSPDHHRQIVWTADGPPSERFMPYSIDAFLHRSGTPPVARILLPDDALPPDGTDVRLFVGTGAPVDVNLESEGGALHLPATASNRHVIPAAEFRRICRSRGILDIRASGTEWNPGAVLLRVGVQGG